MLAKKLFTYIICCLLPVCSFAFDKTPVRYLGIEQGLSNNAVTSIYQDHNGFMWFGTYDGLNRYDGYGFKTFRNIIRDSSSLSDNHVSVIQGDASHRLWVGCEKGLSIFNPIKSNFFTPLFKPWRQTSVKLLHDGIRAIERIDANELMLVGTQHEGLIVFYKNNPVGSQIPLQSLSGKELNYGITAIAFDVQKKIAWIFIPEVGLCLFDIGKQTLRVSSTAIKKADCLKVDSKGNLWLGNENGLFQYNPQTASFSTNVLSYPFKVVNLYEDRKNVLWISSDGGGVLSMQPGSKLAKPFLSEAGTPLVNSNAIYAVYEDTEGGKWIGTLRGGVNIIQPRRSSFQHIVYNASERNDLVENFILSFSEDEKNNVWIGTDGAGLRYWDRQKNTFRQYVHNPSDPNSLSSNFVTNILRDARGDLWFATWFGGVNRMKKGTKVFERLPIYNKQNGDVDKNAWLVFEDVQKRIWVSTTNDGTLYLFNREKNSFDVFDKNLVNIQSLAEDRSGNLWVGNYTSLIQLDPVNKKHKSYKVNYTVRCIYEDKAKNLWVGTDGGGLLLFNRTKGSFQRFTTSEGLPSNTVLRLLEDKNGNIWLSTYNGLCRFTASTKTFRNYSQSDGLQSNQFSFNAALALQNGEFLFGGIKGFNVFHPDSVYDKNQDPNIFLTGLRINNKPVEDDDSYVTKRDVEKIETITLPYSQAILSLDFVALEYSGADKIKYAYQLDGWDKSWNYVNDSRTANYSRLEEGSYTFKLRATNAAGIWGNETKLLTILVLPPWYRTWWAYAAYLLLAVSIVFLYIQYKTRQARLKFEVKLAHLEAEKEKELNEKKLTFFTDVSHEFRTPLTLIINPLKEYLSGEKGEQKDLNIVYRNARRLLSLVDQLLLFQKAETERESLKRTKLNFYSLCKDVFSSFEAGARSKKIEYAFIADNAQLPLCIDREKMEIVLYNLLSNALKFTPEGGKISLRIMETENEVQVSVEDNGPGIPQEVGSHLFERFYQVQKTKTQSKPGFGIGLYLVKHFMEKHQGTVFYKSQPGLGTTFTLTLPKGVAYSEIELFEDVATDKTLLTELIVEDERGQLPLKENLEELVHSRRSILIIEDEEDIRHYVTKIFKEDFAVYEAKSGEQGLRLAQEFLPDIIISDVMMQNGTGLELCHSIKNNPALSHIPVILLTAVSSSDIKLKGVESGADDYITKPFEKELLIARVASLLKNKTALQQYFYNEVTLQKTNFKISAEYKEFLDRCIAIVESHLEDDDFTIKKLTQEIGMSHSNLYRKVKAISGQSVSAFIRFLRLRKAAELMLKSNLNVNEASFQVGISDVKYFRKQFQKVFGMNPSEYIKKYRGSFGDEFSLHKKMASPQDANL